MLPPVKREQLRQRNLRDFAEESSAAAQRSPSLGIVQTLELSEVVRRLNAVTHSGASKNALEHKARLYAHPLRALLRA